MTDRPETESVTLSIPARLADFIGSVWTKTLAILAAISIVIGILLEIESLVTGYYGFQKAVAEAEISRINASLAYDGRSAEVQKAIADAEISQVNAKYAYMIGKYP